jgi:hypothetical protein
MTAIAKPKADRFEAPVVRENADLVAELPTNGTNPAPSRPGRVVAAALVGIGSWFLCMAPILPTALPLGGRSTIAIILALAAIIQTIQVAFLEFAMDIDVLAMAQKHAPRAIAFAAIPIGFVILAKVSDPDGFLRDFLPEALGFTWTIGTTAYFNVGYLAILLKRRIPAATPA